jgi:DNA polymerase-3 subunit delta
MAAKDAYAGNEKILWKSIKSNEIGRLYLFYGIEEYLIRNYCAQIEKALIPEDFKLLNKVVLNGRTSPEQIIENCRTTPVFADRRLVVVKDSGLFKGGKKADGDDRSAGTAKKGRGSGSKARSGDALAEFLADVPEHVCLIFIEQEIDKRIRYVDLIDKYGLIVDFEYKKPDEMAGWVIKRLREMGHDAAARTAAMIVDYCEQGMDDVLNELKKLCAYAGDRAMITEDDVAKVCTRSVKSRIFDLTDAIAAKQTSAAISILDDMAVLREPMPKVLFMITRQFRQLIQAKLLLGDGAGRGEIASYFKVPPFIADKMIRQARSFDMESLEEAAARGLELDIAVKTGNMDDRTAVELLIIGSSGKKQAVRQ